MTTVGPSDNRPDRTARREATRDKARQLRETQRKRERRGRLVLQSGIAVAVLAVLAVVAIVIVGAIRPAEPGPANMASDGIVIGTGLKAERTPSLPASAKPVPTQENKSSPTVSIRLYIDYLCPYCGQFERTNSAQLTALAKSGAATIEIHPIAFLTSNSAGTKYSLRAANAAACVANFSPNRFYAYHLALFKNEPAENTAGLPDSELKSLAAGAGVTQLSNVDRCIDDGRYENWVSNATDRAFSGPIPNSNVKKLTGTPLVIVNGKQYTGSLQVAADFKAFILQAQSESYSSAPPTPSATPSATPTSTSTSTPGSTSTPTSSATSTPSS